MATAAMASRRPEWMKGLDPDQIEFYQRLTPEQAVCRGTRRHSFWLKEMIPGRGVKIPKSLNVIPAIDGVYQVTDWCTRGCGRFIRYDTLPGGGIDWSSARYGGESSYLATGLGLAAGNDAMFLHYLQDGVLADALKLAAKRTAVAQEAASPPEVKFSN